MYCPGKPGKYPVLFASSPYIKDSIDLPSTSMYRYRETGHVGKWVERGYVYVHADVRGSGKSEGSYDVWGPKEQSDYVLGQTHGPSVHFLCRPRPTVVDTRHRHQCVRQGRLHAYHPAPGAYTSPPMEQDMEVTGPVMLKLWGSTTAKNMQFIANIMDMGPMPPEVAAAHKLLDVAAPARKVTMGWLKASHRALDPARSAPLSPYHTHENPQALEPGKVYEFNIEIWPTCWVFKAGHRIRLEIMSFDGQHHIGHLRGTDTFHHDSSRPSHLQLSVVPS